MNINQARESHCYGNSTTASAVRSLHNSASRREVRSNLSNPEGRDRSGSSNRDCCNIKRVQFDLSNYIAPDPLYQQKKPKTAVR